MFCPSCGNEVEREAVFCSKCGKTLTGPANVKRSTSNLMISIAAIAAVAAIGIAVWSSLRVRQSADGLQAQASIPRPVATPTSAPTPETSPTPAVSPNPEIEPGDYETYENDRFDYSISYPSNFLIPQGVSANGDGQRFVSKDNRVVMSVFGQHNAMEKSLTELFEAELKPSRTVTYKLLKDKWFVVSGYEGDKVFYLKTRLKDDVIKTFHIEADRALQSAMQPITEKIVKSFK